VFSKLSFLKKMLGALWLFGHTWASLTWMTHLEGLEIQQIWQACNHLHKQTDVATRENEPQTGQFLCFALLQ